MKFLAMEIDSPRAEAKPMQAYLLPEAQKVWELHKRDIIRETYFQEEKHLAVLILECQDLAEARSVIRSLPLVETGLIDFDLVPLVPYDGFERLFS